MSLTLKTKDFLKVVNQLSKVKVNKILEISRYWHIFGTGEEVTFTAYDGSNFMRVIVESDAEIDVMVKAEQLSKLIEKTTTEEITLTVKDSSLEVKGNGKYYVEIVTEDEAYPSYEEYLPEDIAELDPLDVSTKVFSDIANINSSAVSKSNADGIYTCYLIKNNKAVTTDIIKVCISDTFDFGQDLLISSELMDLLASIEDDELYVWILERGLYVTSATTELYGPLHEGIEEYVDVNQIKQNTFDTEVELPTVNVQNVIDRLSLVMKEFDKNTIKLSFTKKGVQFSTKAGSNELVPFAKPVQDIEAFVCLLNSSFLRDILATVNTQSFSLVYGNDSAIGIKTATAEYYLALQEEDEEGSF